MRLLLALAVALVVLLAGAAWFLLASHSNSTSGIDVGGMTSAVESARGDTALDASSHVQLATQDEHDRPAEQRASLATPAPAPVADAIDTKLPAAPLEARVLDQRTELPLPRFLVRLHDSAGRRVDVVSDDEGKFTTVPLAVGNVDATPLDHERRSHASTPVTWDHLARDERPFALELASGPTYRIALEPEEGPDPALVDLRLEVACEDERTNTAMEPLRTEAPYRLEGEPYWVRFTAMEPRFDRALSIHARTRDGLWIGDAQVETIQGEAPGLVTIHMDARAVLQGRVLCDGAPVPDAVVRLSVDSQDPNGRPSQRSTRTGGDGHYRFEYQRAGQGHLNVRSMRHETAEDAVTLRSGESVDHDVLVIAKPLAGSISGAVVSETGAYERRVHLTLSPTGERGRDVPQMRVTVRWDKSGAALIGHFDFGGLPAGKYHVQLEEDDWFEWNSHGTDVEPPKQDIVFTVHDRILAADLVLQVHDADNGLALDGYHLQLETYDNYRSMWSWSGAVLMEQYPEDKRLRWRLDKPGYPPQFGDLSNFDVRTVVDGRSQRTAEVNMSPGWGDLLRVVKRNNQQPLGGVAVMLDGKEAGRTDSNGIARVTARQQPKHIELVLDGWKMRGPVDMSSPSKRSWARVNTVQMQPAPKKK